MRKYWSILAFLMVCSPLQATTYYVANAGSDAANGTSIGTPWQTIAHVQATLTGDQHSNSVLFNRGDSWREQFSPGMFGTAAGQFTIGAYGAGASPIISGSDLLNSGWSNVAGGNSAIFKQYTYVPERNSASIASITSPSIVLAAGDFVVVSCGTPENLTSSVATSTPANTFAPLTFANNANGTGIQTSYAMNVSAGSTTFTCTPNASAGYQSMVVLDYSGVATSAALDVNIGDGSQWDPGYVSAPFSTTSSATELMLLCGRWGDFTKTFTAGSMGAASAVLRGVSGSSITGNANQACEEVTTTATQTNITASLTYGQSNPIAVNIGTFISRVGTTNVWQRSMTTQPHQVFFNGIPGTLVASAGAVSAPGQWYWAANVIYVYSTSDPATAFTNPGVEASQRQYAVYLSAKNYITIQGLNLTETNNAGVFVYSGSTNFLITGNSINYCGYQNYDAGVEVMWGSNGRITGNKIYGSFNGIVLSTYVGEIVDSIQVDHNAVSYSQWAGIMDEGSVTGSPTVFVAGPTNVVIEYNSTIYSSQKKIDLSGIYTYASGAGTVIRYNISANNGTAAYYSSGYMIDVVSQPMLFYGNVGYGSNHGCIASASSGHLIYGNTCYNNNTQGWNDGELFLFNSEGVAASSLTVKNNIFVATTGKYVLTADSSSVTGHTFNYNLYSASIASPFLWSGTSYNFANYKTASSQDANSLNSAPTFYNSSAGQFWQTVGSSGIAAGTALGAPYNTGIYPGSSWPNNVFLIPNLNNDLGAYPYTGYIIDAVTGSGTQSSGTTK